MGTWEDPEECLNGVPLKHTSRDHCAGWGRLVRYPQPFFPYAGGGVPAMSPGRPLQHHRGELLSCQDRCPLC